MNFIEAVKAINEGKKVRRPTWADDAYIFISGYFDEVIFNKDDGFEDQYYEMNKEEINATDWEIVDEDKDWKLTDELPFSNCLDTETNIKKCRDLILEDLKKEDLIDSNHKSRTEIIINKRFGGIQ